MNKQLIEVINFEDQIKVYPKVWFIVFVIFILIGFAIWNSFISTVIIPQYYYIVILAVLLIPLYKLFVEEKDQIVKITKSPDSRIKINYCRNFKNLMLESRLDEIDVLVKQNEYKRNSYYLEIRSVNMDFRIRQYMSAYWTLELMHKTAKLLSPNISYDPRK